MSIIQLRRDTTANWLSVNPVLAQGELGIAYNGDVVATIRIGNGASTWTQLPDFGGNGDLTQAAADLLYATLAQGELADSAVQPGDLPTFGDVVTHNASEFATAAEGGSSVNYPIGDGASSQPADAGDTYDLLVGFGLTPETFGGSATLPSATLTLTPGDHTGKFAAGYFGLEFNDDTIPPINVYGVTIRYSGLTGGAYLTFSLENGAKELLPGGCITNDGEPEDAGDLGPFFGYAVGFGGGGSAGSVTLYVDQPFNQHTGSVHLVITANGGPGTMTDPATVTIDSVEYIPYPILPATGDAARYIEPFMAFEFGPITDAIWGMAPPGALFWCQEGGGGEGRMTRGFYRTDGTSTLVRDESYDVDAPFTVIHVLLGLYEDVSDFVDQQAHPAGMSLLWVFSDWNATKQMPANYVGTTADLVSVDYEPENYTPTPRYEGAGVFRPGRLLGDHLAGIDNAIGKVVTSTTNAAKTSDATPAAHAQLSVALEANGLYLIRANIHYSGVSTYGQVALGFSGPTGAATVGGMSALGMANGASNSPSTAYVGTGTTTVGLGQTAIFGGPGNSGGTDRRAHAIIEAVVQMSSTAGDISVIWAQGTSNVTASTVFAGSTLTVTKIG